MSNIKWEQIYKNDKIIVINKAKEIKVKRYWEKLEKIKTSIVHIYFNFFTPKFIISYFCIYFSHILYFCLQ